MAKCPECTVLIDYLDYLQYDKGIGTISLENDGIEIERPNKTKRQIFVQCPLCKSILFYSLVNAARWLQGEIYVKQVNPALTKI